MVNRQLNGVFIDLMVPSLHFGIDLLISSRPMGAPFDSLECRSQSLAHQNLLEHIGSMDLFDRPGMKHIARDRGYFLAGLLWTPLQAPPRFRA